MRRFELEAEGHLSSPGRSHRKKHTHTKERNFWTTAETTGGVQGGRRHRRLFLVVNFHSSRVCLEEICIFEEEEEER